MKKKALGFMLAATMTVSVLAGCGGNQNEGNTNEKENVTNSNEDTQSVSAETNENGNRIIKTVIGIILALLIGCTFTWLIKIEQSSDKVNWNNGYCVECGNKWRFANADYIKNVGTIYYWTCDNCGKVIELHSNFKQKK